MSWAFAVCTVADNHLPRDPTRRITSLELNKELTPIGIDAVLCEGGVGGRTPMFESLLEGVAQFGQGESAYTRVEGHCSRIRRQLRFDCSRSADTAAMIADACLVASPAVRHPLSDQAAIDAAHAISDDDDYLRLCAYDDESPAVVTRNGVRPVWLIA